MNALAAGLSTTKPSRLGQAKLGYVVRGLEGQPVADGYNAKANLESIHNNRSRRGDVDDLSRWRNASACNDARQQGLIEVVSDWMEPHLLAERCHVELYRTRSMLIRFASRDF
ncbi:MAG: hypothetical protein ACK5Q5_17340 [Planctomycetaceae bacterium]